MKTTLLGAILFTLATAFVYTYDASRVQAVKFPPTDTAVIEGIKTSQDIEQLRTLALLTLKAEGQAVQAYNEMLEHHHDITGSVCMLAAILFIIAFLDIKGMSAKK